MIEATAKETTASAEEVLESTVEVTLPDKSVLDDAVGSGVGVVSVAVTTVERPMAMEVGLVVAVGSSEVGESEETGVPVAEGSDEAVVPGSAVVGVVVASVTVAKLTTEGVVVTPAPVALGSVLVGSVLVGSVLVGSVVAEPTMNDESNAPASTDDVVVEVVSFDCRLITRGK